MAHHPRTKSKSCPRCEHTGLDLGRGLDGRRAYRCQKCGHEWTDGRQGRRQRYSPQRIGMQFANTGAHRWGEEYRMYGPVPGCSPPEFPLYFKTFPH